MDEENFRIYLAMNSSSWDVSPKEAVTIQQKLRAKVQLRPIPHKVRRIGGVDLSYNIGSDVVFAALVILDMESLQVIARSGVQDRMSFPYIPGLLSFREIPSLMKAWEQLDAEYKPDVIMADGQGIAHPRRIGVATHLGLLTQTPTIGCAKNILVGTHNELGEQKGSVAEMIDKGERVGYALRTKNKVKPVYISPGHLISFEQSLHIALQCAGKYRIPEPTRQAHLTVNAMRRGEIETGFRLL